jgi:hypothetical protein
MADYPVRNPNPKSPGVSGAIKDALKAVSDYVAPKSITQRKAKIEQGVDESLGRMREGQSTDSNNF